MFPSNHRRVVRGVAASLLVVALAGPPAVSAGHATRWGPATLEVNINSPQADGCPIETFDGLHLYFASNRPGAIGGATDPNDIWMASRTSKRAPWNEPVHLPAPVNSSAADFCPTPLPGGRLFFVSTRVQEGACGAGDIYRTRYRLWKGWAEPRNLGCADDGGPNFAGGEFSPSILETWRGTVLYYSSTGLDGLDQDIYMSRQRRDGSFGPGRLVRELSTDANDQMPNVSRNGLEMVFVSDRDGGQGGFDVYTSHRASTHAAWSKPVNVGSNVNTAASESRPSLSGDGHRLHFGRSGEIYVSTR